MPRTRKPAAKAHSDAQIMQFTGQQYGAQAKQIAAQRAVPAHATKAQIEYNEKQRLLAADAGPNPATSGIRFDDQHVDMRGVHVAGTGGGITPSPSPGPDPGSLGDLFAPSTRPSEPLTAGMPFGPGPNEVPFRASPDEQAVDRLRAVYRQTGLASLGRLLEAWEDQ